MISRNGGGDNQLWDDLGDAVAVLDLVAQFQVFADAFAIVIKIGVKPLRVGIGQLRQAAVAGADDVGDGGLAGSGGLVGSRRRTQTTRGRSFGPSQPATYTMPRAMPSRMMRTISAIPIRAP